MNADDFTDEGAALVHELLPGASAIGAYAMGAVTAMALQVGMVPDWQLLAEARDISMLRAIEPLFVAWRRTRRESKHEKVVKVR